MFQELLARYKQLCERKYSKAKSFDNWMKARRAKLYKQYYPKDKKIKWDKMEKIPEFTAFEAKMKERNVFSRFWDYWNDRVTAADKETFEAAQSLKPNKTDSFVLFDRVSSGMYSTQGFGAISYAKRAAQAKGDIAAANDIEFEIRTTNQHRTSGPFGQDWCDFEVWVKTDEVGVEILKRKQIPFVEIIRLSWKRGGQPRVNYPFLPYGYEEQNGIDYFGNVVDEEKYQRALKNS